MDLVRRSKLLVEIGTFLCAHLEKLFESKIQCGIDRGPSRGIEDPLLRSRDNSGRPKNSFDRYLAGQRELFLECLNCAR